MPVSDDRFSTIGTIVPEERSTWEGRVFLTIDIDWASDDILAETIDLLESGGAAATFFVTHRTSLLERLRANPNFELGIHPNFNHLLTGGPGDGRNAGEILESLIAIVPEARSVRSHSMTQSSRLLDLFHSAGLTHDSNHFIPARAGMALAPYRHWNGLVRVPYFWEDDVSLLYGDTAPMDDLLATPGLKVFDFHPIHVTLNSTNIGVYENSRHVHHDRTLLREYARSGSGVRTTLERLLQIRGAS